MMGGGWGRLVPAAAACSTPAPCVPPFLLLLQRGWTPLHVAAYNSARGGGGPLSPPIVCRPTLLSPPIADHRAVAAVLMANPSVRLNIVDEVRRGGDKMRGSAEASWGGRGSEEDMMGEAGEGEGETTADSVL